MSTSTVSVTANTAAASRRRPVLAGEKRSGLDLGGGTDSIAVASPVGGVDKVTSSEIGRDLSHSIRGETVLERSREAVQAKKIPNSTGTALPRRTTARKSASKPDKPRWLTVVSVFTKNFLLLLVLLLLAQMIRRLALGNSQGSGVEVVTLPSSDYEGRIAEMESFLKTTTKLMQVQVEVVDRKIGSEIAGLRTELGKKISENGVELLSQLKKMDARVESVEKLLGENEWLAKEDFDKFVEEFKKAKGIDGSASLDEVRAFAREIIGKEIEKHSADGLGMVDYALASGGATIVKHSEPYFGGKISSWLNRNGVHSNAWKMLKPSFGEPGECFPLKGSSGFVNIKLRTAIVPEAITLEHVAKSVAYDRSSAPKECRIYGWLGGHEVVDTAAVDSEKMVLLTEFSYDLEKSNAQTFNVLESEGGSGSGIVDRIRLDFTSNHGSPTYTCIYRLRVHGHEPNLVPTLAVQS